MSEDRAAAPDVFSIARLLVDHTVRAFPGEVAIVAYYGSHAKGTASSNSDLDLFYIPDEGKADALSSQFVIDGLPYDFWPISWSFAEHMANALPGRPWVRAASLIADAKVLYSRSAADLDRFTALQARVAELTRPERSGYMLDRAMESYTDAMAQLGRLHVAPGERPAAKRFVDAIVNCLALVNQTYFAKGWEADASQVMRLARRPDDFDALARRVLVDLDVGAAQILAIDTRRIVLDAQTAQARPAAAADVFKDAYPGVYEFVNKVLSACGRGNAVAALVAAVQLHEEVCRGLHHVAHGTAPADINLLSDYDRAYAEAGLPDLVSPAVAGDLAELAQRARALDARFREWLAERGAALNILEDEAALQRFLANRCTISASQNGG